jgi:hypothetical protein
LVPIAFDVGHESGDYNQIDRTVAECLIGDVNVTALRVLRNRLHEWTSVISPKDPARSIAAIPANMPPRLLGREDDVIE